MIKLMQGDCLEVMWRIEKESVDCVIIDPPYFNVVNETWDKQWKTLSDFIDWLETVIIQLKRILKSNGSLYIFADDKVCAYVQVMIDKHLTLLNNIVWHKTNNMPIKNAHLLRSFAPMTERILFYTPQLCKTGLDTIKSDADLFKSIKKYLREEKEKSGLTLTDLNEILTGKRKSDLIAKRYFGDSQWELPTKEMYAKLQTTGFFQRDYENSKEEYEGLRQEYERLRRVFNAGDGRFDVIHEKIITTKENTSHPTTKPTRLIKRFIEASTNKGDLVLDCFMGSGTTGVACKFLDRDFIGIEKEPEHFELSQVRINGTAKEIKKEDDQQVTF